MLMVRANTEGPEWVSDPDEAKGHVDVCSLHYHQSTSADVLLGAEPEAKLSSGAQESWPFPLLADASEERHILPWSAGH